MPQAAMLLTIFSQFFLWRSCFLRIRALKLSSLLTGSYLQQRPLSLHAPQMGWTPSHFDLLHKVSKRPGRNEFSQRVTLRDLLLMKNTHRCRQVAQAIVILARP